MSRPAVWGSGITWGDFTWGETTTTGLPVLYVAIDGEAVGEAYAARFRLGRSAWFDVLSPNTASVELATEVSIPANSELILTCGAGMLWKGYVDSCVITYRNGNDLRTTIQATDVVGRLGRSIKAPIRVEASGDLVARAFEIGIVTDVYTDGTLLDLAAYYLDEYAPGLSIDVVEGTSTGTLPVLISSWMFDAPGPMPRKTVLELLNKAEQSSNAMMAMQPDGTLLVVPRAPSGLSTVDMVSVEDGESTWNKGRDTVINRWLLERPAYDDTTVLDATDTTSRELYGEQAYEVQDFLCATATHFPSAFRDALASPRWQAVYTRTVDDLSSPWLLLAPLAWAYDGGRDATWQVMSVEHDVTVDGWRVTVALDASQDALNGETEPTPA